MVPRGGEIGLAALRMHGTMAYFAAFTLAPAALWFAVCDLAVGARSAAARAARGIPERSSLVSCIRLRAANSHGLDRPGVGDVVIKVAGPLSQQGLKRTFRTE